MDVFVVFDPKIGIVGVYGTFERAQASADANNMATEVWGDHPNFIVEDFEIVDPQ